MSYTSSVSYIKLVKIWVYYTWQPPDHSSTFPKRAGIPALWVLSMTAAMLCNAVQKALSCSLPTSRPRKLLPSRPGDISPFFQLSSVAIPAFPGKHFPTNGINSVCPVYPVTKLWYCTFVSHVRIPTIGFPSDTEGWFTSFVILTVKELSAREGNCFILQLAFS